jgi:hypothetical protein
LLARDTNGRYDAYMWEEGELHLLSTGKSPHDSFAHGMSANGDDVFFRTREALVPQDVDSSIDLYTAHVGGGLASQQDTPPDDCDGDACQGEPSPKPTRQGLGSETLDGHGNVPRPPSTGLVLRVSAARVQRTFAIAVRVRTAGRGRISASGPRVRTTRKRTARGGTHRLIVPLTARARKALENSRRLRVRIRVVYRPSTGRPASRSLALTLKHSGRKGR